MPSEPNPNFGPHPPIRATVAIQPTVAPVRRRRHPHFLEQVKGEGAPSRFNLSTDELVIGRDPGTDIQVGGEAVSRRHAKIKRVNQQYAIQDLDSSHGIYLNGIKVYSAVLHDGDAIQLGDAVFVYEEG